jgi:7-cyano-7-deazaguanine reductase
VGEGEGDSLAAGAGADSGVSVGAGVMRGAGRLRGGIATPARSSAGPAGAALGVGVGVGVWAGSEKLTGVSCAASGIAASSASGTAARRKRGIGGRVMAVFRKRLAGSGWTIAVPHRERARLASSSPLAPIPRSGQQRGMNTTPDAPRPAPQFLGKDTPLPSSPEEAVLDYVPNPRPGLTYLVRFVSPEFTSLCPVTNQPDFAHLVIDYVPGETIVESKSLKLFLGSFRNHNGFHEDVTVGIGVRLFEEMRPQWLRIGGYWYPRGGIPIDVFWQSGPAPEGLWLPDQGVQSYRGRG